MFTPKVDDFGSYFPSFLPGSSQGSNLQGFFANSCEFVGGSNEGETFSVCPGGLLFLVVLVVGLGGSMI